MIRKRTKLGVFINARERDARNTMSTPSQHRRDAGAQGPNGTGQACPLAQAREDEMHPQYETYPPDTPLVDLPPAALVERLVSLAEQLVTTAQAAGLMSDCLQTCGDLLREGRPDMALRAIETLLAPLDSQMERPRHEC